MASYGTGPVSLPKSTDGSPWVEEVVDDEGRHYLLDIQCMLRSEDDVAADEACDGPITPYWDPVLKHNRKMYIRFIRDLASRGMIQWSRTCRQKVSCFFCSQEGWVVAPRH